MSMKKHYKQKGFTLIELLLVIALMSIAVGVTGDILVSLIRSYNKSNVLNEIEQNANFVSQKLGKELRNATQVVSLDPVGASPPNLGDAFNEIEMLDRNGTAITYKVTVGGVITRKVGAGADENLTINSPPNGVKASCIGGATNCFTLIGTSPQVVKISIRIEQSGSPTSKVFQGNIDIEDTIVIRDTY